MKTKKSIVCREVIRSRKGEVIGSKEVINEFYEADPEIECVTRAIIKLADGRVFINNVIKRTKKPRNQHTLNLLPA